MHYLRYTYLIVYEVMTHVMLIMSDRVKKNCYITNSPCENRGNLRQHELFKCLHKKISESLYGLQ